MNIFYKAKKDVSHFSAHMVETFKREGFAQFFLKSCGKMVRLTTERARSQDREELEFDRRFGTDTATSVPAWKLSDVPSPNRVHATNYVASREKDVLMLFDMLPIQVEDYVLLDFGSGKGKVLLLAAEYGFKEVIGVEFSLSLHAIAQANIERYKAVTSSDCSMESVCQDAAQFTIPSKKLVIFLYGPFHEPVFQSVVANLRKSLEVYDRPIYVVNFGSPLAKAIQKVDFLYPFPGKSGQWIYSNKPMVTTAPRTE
jgi:SAM-dependent methyltransferase